jgi:hypothetical protein
MTTPTQAAYYARYYDAPATREEPDGTVHWITRAANFVVVVTRAKAGAVLERVEQPDESMLLLPEGMGARIEAAGESISSEGDSLTILPPGPSRITVAQAGHVYRVFSHRAADLAAAADNAADYANGAPNVSPLVPWPDPVGGFKLRHYRLADHVRPDNPMRLFRSTNLMINIFVPQNRPRDTKKMTPHAHSEFEQASLTLEGPYVHHMRYPWTADMDAWRDDEHGHVDSPSLVIIPPNVIHTTQSLPAPRTRLVDVFAPPRADFSLKPGLVRNADDYPLPPDLAALPPVSGPLA